MLYTTVVAKVEQEPENADRNWTDMCICQLVGKISAVVIIFITSQIEKP
jgi:hypothetical protein